MFHQLIYQPLYNSLIFLYNVIPGKDFGIAIIALTIIIRFLLIPVYKKQIESQKKLQELQPKIKKVQKKYKSDKEKQTRELMNLYKEHKTNPFSGCLPLIIQIIFLIAFYRVLLIISQAGLVADTAELYSFIENPGKINDTFLFLVDLTRPSIVLAVLAAIAQYFQTKMLMGSRDNLIKQKGENKDKNNKEEKKDGEPDFAQMMNKQMLYVGPFLTLFIGIKFAAGLALYWLTSTLFMLLQQIYIQKKKETEKLN